MPTTINPAWLKAQAKQKNFSGWDFSAIEAEYTQEANPWNYQKIVQKFLQPELQLLDMGTGGGELLKSFNHPPKNTAVTEGWPKNYQLLLEKLDPQGVAVKFVKEDDKLNFPDQHFDLVINSHESFDLKEVKRVLKPGGNFISQQVGDLNGLTLTSRLIPNFQKKQFDWHLATVKEQLKGENFQLLFADEAYPWQKFYTMEALIYYALTISWEFPNFSVENNLQELLYLEEELNQKGFIANLEHRFIFVAVKPNE
ncbi:class I SAM-dependent methyltransferase [Enterococcus sp. LJL120]